MKTFSREADRAEILDRLRRLRPDSERRWGRMTPHQAVCHLADSCRMMLGERAVAPTGNLLQHTLIKWLALYAPLAWPAGVPTSVELDQARCAASGRSFADDVAPLESLIHLIARERRAEWPRHPIFGAMSGRDWFRWAYLHKDHHLRQFGV